MPYLLALTRLPHRPDLTASAAFPMFWAKLAADSTRVRLGIGR